MSTPGFALDPRLAADTLPVASLPLCDVLLMNDSRYPWLILVPRRHAVVEIADLDEHEQAVLWQEVNRAGAALRTAGPCDKLNVGALGNIVRQLHVHVVVRRIDDHAWPGPVWGNGGPAPYTNERSAALISMLQGALTP
ncbi:MAG TPA: HIT family protein [Rhodanobacter sp.]